jgi:stage V sporulation protein K
MPQLLDELDALVGIESVKQQIRDLTGLIEVEQRRRELGIGHGSINLNTVLFGNPGTGKTTIARILGRVFGDLNVLSGTKFTEVTSHDLLGQYVGESRQRTARVCDRALGGVLFIDDAYDLEPRDANSIGQIEVITELLKFMLERNRDLAVIMAGYKDPMERFLRANPGLHGRIAHFFNLPDLSNDELYLIFRKQAQAAGLVLSDDCNAVVRERFAAYRARCTEIGQHFRNGGEACKLMDFVTTAQAKRLQSRGVQTLDVDDVRTILPEDIRAAKFGDA